MSEPTWGTRILIEHKEKEKKHIFVIMFSIFCVLFKFRKIIIKIVTGMVLHWDPTGLQWAPTLSQSD